MKTHAQVIVTIDSSNHVSAKIWIRDGDAPTFDDGKLISDNFVRPECGYPRHPHFEKGPNAYEFRAVTAAAQYLAEVVASQPPR